MKKITYMLIASLFLLLVGCNTTEKQQQSGGEVKEPIPIVVDLKMSKEAVNPGETVTFQATVTQGDDPVDDADEMKFEIIENGLDEGQEVPGKHDGDGVYSFSKTFDHAGIYTVTAHVTARGMHTMPNVEVTVGDPQTPTTSDEPATGEEHNHGTHQHGHGQVAIEFETESEYKRDEEIDFLAKLSTEGKALTAANVRFEIWKDGTDKHEYITSAEILEGQYKGEYKFGESGLFHVQVHVEKGDIHEHLEKTITVK